MKIRVGLWKTSLPVFLTNKKSGHLHSGSWKGCIMNTNFLWKEDMTLHLIKLQEYSYWRRYVLTLYKIKIILPKKTHLKMKNLHHMEEKASCLVPVVIRELRGDWLPTGVESWARKTNDLMLYKAARHVSEMQKVLSNSQWTRLQVSQQSAWKLRNE